MPNQLTREEIEARLKNGHAFPHPVNIIPPVGMKAAPTVQLPSDGMSNYFYIIGQAVSGCSMEGTTDQVAQRAIDIADMVFQKLALKFDLGEEALAKRQ